MNLTPKKLKGEKCTECGGTVKKVGFMECKCDCTYYPFLYGPDGGVILGPITTL